MRGSPRVRTAASAMMPSSRNDKPPRLLTMSTTEEPVDRHNTSVRLSRPLPSVGQKAGRQRDSPSPDCTGTRDTVEEAVMWSNMSVTISLALAICQSESQHELCWTALVLDYPGPGSPLTFIRRTPASPWIPVDRFGHC